MSKSNGMAPGSGGSQTWCAGRPANLMRSTTTDNSVGPSVTTSVNGWDCSSLLGRCLISYGTMTLPVKVEADARSSAETYGAETWATRNLS